MIPGTIVKARRTKTHLVVLGVRVIDGTQYAQVKEVNPDNHDQMMPGEFALPLKSLTEVKK